MLDAIGARLTMAAMPDPHLLREIVDALRVLKGKAKLAECSDAAYLLIKTAVAINDMAKAADVEHDIVRPEPVTRMLLED